MLPYLRLEDIDLYGKTVVMRVDFNSPVDIEDGILTLNDTKRIDDHIDSTIIPLFNSKRPPRNIVLLAHQGRRGARDCTTLRPHFEHCRAKLKGEQIKTFYIWEELNDEEVASLGEEAVSPESVSERINGLRERTVLLLENVRFSEAEEKTADHDFRNNPLIKRLSKVNNRVVALDGFSVAHRAQPSVTGLAVLGPLYAGPVVLREIQQLSRALEHPDPPMVLVVGGAKTDDSLQSIERFLSNGKAHKVLTGGLPGLMLLLAQGFQLNAITLTNIKAGTTNFEDALSKAKSLLDVHGTETILVPRDLAIGPNQGLADTRETISLSEGQKSRFQIGDIGIETIALYNSEIAQARTIVMNGPVGRYEWQMFFTGD